MPSTSNYWLRLPHIHWLINRVSLSNSLAAPARIHTFIFKSSCRNVEDHLQYLRHQGVQYSLGFYSWVRCLHNMECDQTNQGINKSMEIRIYLFDMGRNGGKCRDDGWGVFAHQRSYWTHVWFPVSTCMHLIPPFSTKTNINVSDSLAFALILRELSKKCYFILKGTGLREIKCRAGLLKSNFWCKSSSIGLPSSCRTSKRPSE